MLKHKLTTSEVYFFLDGTGIMHVQGKKISVKKHDSILIEPNEEQWLENTGDTELTFLVIVSPAWKKQDEKILE